MKRFGWILLLFVAAAPAWSAGKKITVEQLKDLLTSMQGKSDDDVATALKQVELTEELTRNTMNTMVGLVPGKLATEQMYVLEARSAMLAPPATDIPTSAPLDAAAQKALLDKATDYATKTYGQLPALTATKTILRFQDNVETPAASSGMKGSATDVSTGSGFSNPSGYVRYINAYEVPAVSANGAEQSNQGKDKTPWGANGQVYMYPPGPVLSTVLQEAESSGPITFVRWEMVNGKQAAVFSFTVDKKKTRYTVNYCCFPNTDQAGTLNFSAKSAAGSAPSSTQPTAHGNFQTNTDWKPFKATVPYHGEIFVNPDTGIVVRLVNMAEFKSGSVVHQEDTRIDYGPVQVGDKTLVLPVDSFVASEVMPGGEDYAAKTNPRHTYLSVQYKDYSLAGAAH